MDKKHLIYVFLDGNGNPYYVGKTCDFNRRKRYHLQQIRQGNPLPKYNKARKLIREGIAFVMFVIESEIEAHSINAREIYWIALFEVPLPLGEGILTKFVGPYL